MNVECTPAGWVVKVGPFADEAEARERARMAMLPEAVNAAVLAGEAHVAECRGSYEVRVDGGPGVPRSADCRTYRRFHGRGRAA